MTGIAQFSGPAAGRAARPPGGPANALLALAFFLAVAAPARAHDIYTSFAEAKLLPDRMELTLTLGRANAHRLLPEPEVGEEKLPPLTPENFPASASRLRTAAAELFQITAAGKPLALSAPADVKISGDSDVTFTLVYPRPTAGPLKFFARYLGYLVDGHTATVILTDATDADLGWSPVSIEQPVFEVALPDPSRVKKAAPKK